MYRTEIVCEYDTLIRNVNTYPHDVDALANVKFSNYVVNCAA